MKILEKDFDITAKDKEEIQNVCWLNDLIRKNSEKYWSEKGERRGRDKTLLRAYLNMKKANWTDNFICDMLGISASKLRAIKKMAVDGEAQTVKTV